MVGCLHYPDNIQNLCFKSKPVVLMPGADACKTFVYKYLAQKQDI